MVDPPSAKYLAFWRLSGTLFQIQIAQFYVISFGQKALVIDERI
jgi:hypothetical protein